MILFIIPLCVVIAIMLLIVLSCCAVSGRISREERKRGKHDDE